MLAHEKRTQRSTLIEQITSSCPRLFFFTLAENVRTHEWCWQPGDFFLSCGAHTFRDRCVSWMSQRHLTFVVWLQRHRRWAFNRFRLWVQWIQWDLRSQWHWTQCTPSSVDFLNNFVNVTKFIYHIDKMFVLSMKKCAMWNLSPFFFNWMALTSYEWHSLAHFVSFTQPTLSCYCYKSYRSARECTAKRFDAITKVACSSWHHNQTTNKSNFPTIVDNIVRVWSFSRTCIWMALHRWDAQLNEQNTFDQCTVS